MNNYDAIKKSLHNAYLAIKNDDYHNAKIHVDHACLDLGASYHDVISNIPLADWKPFAAWARKQINATRRAAERKAWRRRKAVR